MCAIIKASMNLSIKTALFVNILSLSFIAIVGWAQPVVALSSELVIPCRSGNTECWPTAFDFTPTGKAYYVERYSGQIRTYNAATEKDKRWTTLNQIGVDGEQGVLGIALDPRWPDKQWVYVYYTDAASEQNKVVRFRKTNQGTIKRDRLITFPSSWNHNGGVVRFGPDGKLYIVIGDTADATTSQDLSAKPGKVYRLNPNGTIPTDNPFDGSAKWFSYGHRNMYGLAFDPFDPTPSTPEVWVTENGPECNDELNYVELSYNYGWSELADCPDTNNSGVDATSAAYTWTDVIAVTGAEFCDDCQLGNAAEGDLFVGSYSYSTIQQAELSEDRTGVDEMTEVYQHDHGILGMKRNPVSGQIYFSDAYGIYQLGS